MAHLENSSITFYKLNWFLFLYAFLSFPFLDVFSCYHLFGAYLSIKTKVDEVFPHYVSYRAFYDQFESCWFSSTIEQKKLDLKTILIGVTDRKCLLFNYLILRGLNYIYGTVVEKTSILKRAR